MGSIRIDAMRKKYPGMTDEDIAATIATESGYQVIVRYKNKFQSEDITEYSDFACCMTDQEVEGYLKSSNCRDAEIIYDRRTKAIQITPTLILNGKCDRCTKNSSQESLILMGGNDFYICPQCTKMFCDSCIVYLPLTGSPGYAKCPYCDVVLKRAIPGTYA